MCLVGPKTDRVFIAACVMGLVIDAYITKEDQVFSYTAAQLPQVQEAFRMAGEGLCTVQDGKQQVQFFDKKTDLVNCFEAARTMMKPKEAAYASFGLKGADGKSIAYGSCEINKKATEGSCRVELYGRKKSGDMTYKINLSPGA